MNKIKLLFFTLFFFVSSFTVFSQTDDWQQYSSSMAGLKVNYPSDWTLNEKYVGRAWQLTFISPGVFDEDIWVNSAINICIQPIGNKPNPSNTNSGCRQKDDHLSDIAKDKVISEETFQLNGLQIRKKITTDKYRQSETYIYAFFTVDDKEFLISSGFTKRFGLDKYIPVFDQMLKTVQVLKKLDILIYKNDKYDFAITYPTSWKSCPVSKPTEDIEEMLLLVPEGNFCNGGNYISISRMPKYSNDKKLRDLKGFLSNKDFSKVTPYIEFGNIHAAIGESSNVNYIKRERYFYTNYPETYELLKISEGFDKNQEVYQKEAKEILSTAQRFLRTTQ